MALATDVTGDGDSTASDERHFADGRIGQLVGGSYRITRHIGSGGSSHVFEAEHARLGKSFAIKLLRTELDSSRRAAQRFRREAKAIARLQSEHVVSVVDCGELEDQTPYLVMELLQGEDLRSLLHREGPLPVRRAVQLVIEACRGLTVVHEAGLVHRDLKPENIFIARRSTGEDWCKVLDFGVAKMDASLSTAQGAIVGTVRYMAPEQLSDAASVGPATDVYALGAILYECLSGKPVHEGEAIQEVMFNVMHREPAALSQLRPTLPRELVVVVERCLAKRPGQRPQQPAELVRLLRATIGAPSAVSSSTLADGAPTLIVPKKRRSIGLTTAPLMVAAMLGASVAWLTKPTAQGFVPRAEAPAPKASPNAIAQPTQPGAAPTGNIHTAMPAASAPLPAMSAAPMLATHKPATVHNIPAPSATRPATATPPVPVNRFDQANPYGE